MNDETTVKDVVCDMRVSPTSYPTRYQGRDYAFCSAQCLERFEAHPHLYVGLPGQPAPKQRGLVILKQRRFVIGEFLGKLRTSDLQAQIGAMMGIEALEINGNEVLVTYDLLQATALQIETVLQEAGEELSEGLGESLRRGFIHYTEECEISNLEVAPPAGCH